MRVTLVGAGMIPIPPPGYGAVEKHIWNLSQALERRGHEVRIVNKVVGPRSADEYRFAFWARKQVQQEACDVLHLHTPGVATIFQALGPRRFVYTTHSRHWSGVSGLGPRVGHALETRAVHQAAETIAVSRMVAQEIRRPTHVIPNGVDVARYDADWGARDGTRVLGIGEIASHKRWHLAALAMRGLPGQLRLIGPIRDASYANQVEAAGGDKVVLLGPVDEDEMLRELAQADVLVHPSVSESFGMAVVEGMSAGLPVVCSDLLSFLVEHGKQGYLVPTKGDDAVRVEALARHLGELLADAPLRARLGRDARRKAVEGFSWDAVAAQVEGVYGKVVA